MLGDVADGSSLSTVCVHAGNVRVLVQDSVRVCMHSNVTGLCNWNGNEPISDRSGVPFYPAFTSLFQLFQIHCLFATLCLYVWVSFSVCGCVFLCWQHWALQFQPWGPEVVVWKSNHLVIKITSLSQTQLLTNTHTYMHPHSVSTSFPWLCFVTHSSVGQLWCNKDM